MLVTKLIPSTISINAISRTFTSTFPRPNPYPDISQLGQFLNVNAGLKENTETQPFSFNPGLGLLTQITKQDIVTDQLTAPSINTETAVEKYQASGDCYENRAVRIHSAKQPQTIDLTIHEKVAKINASLSPEDTVLFLIEKE